MPSPLSPQDRDSRPSSNRTVQDAQESLLPDHRDTRTSGIWGSLAPPSAATPGVRIGALSTTQQARPAEPLPRTQTANRLGSSQSGANDRKIALSVLGPCTSGPRWWHALDTLATPYDNLALS